MSSKETKAAIEAPGVRTLGSGGGAPLIETDRQWIALVKNAYLATSEGVRIKRKTLTLVLINKLEEILGRTLDGFDPYLGEVNLDGYVFSIREFPGPKESVYDHGLYLTVHCPFCERANQFQFWDRVDLGRLLLDPPGACSACDKPLAVSGVAAS